LKVNNSRKTNVSILVDALVAVQICEAQRDKVKERDVRRRGLIADEYVNVVQWVGAVQPVLELGGGLQEIGLLGIELKAQAGDGIDG
jgi:hypothetical protein